MSVTDWRQRSRGTVEIHLQLAINQVPTHRLVEWRRQYGRCRLLWCEEQAQEALPHKGRCLVPAHTCIFLKRGQILKAVLETIAYALGTSIYFGLVVEDQLAACRGDEVPSANPRMVAFGTTRSGDHVLPG